MAPKLGVCKSYFALHKFYFVNKFEHVVNLLPNMMKVTWEEILRAGWCWMCVVGIVWMCIHVVKVREVMLWEKISFNIMARFKVISACRTDLSTFLPSCLPAPSSSVCQQGVHSHLQAEKISEIPQHAHPRAPFFPITSQHLSHHTHHPVHFLGQILFTITLCLVQSLFSSLTHHPLPVPLHHLHWICMISHLSISHNQREWNFTLSFCVQWILWFQCYLTGCCNGHCCKVWGGHVECITWWEICHYTSAEISASNLWLPWSKVFLSCSLHEFRFILVPPCQTVASHHQCNSGIDKLWEGWR